MSLKKTNQEGQFESNIKQEHGQFESKVKAVRAFEAMEALDVVYNFLMQNDANQHLATLEKIMYFVDEIQTKHNNTQDPLLPQNPLKSPKSKKKVGFLKMGPLEKNVNQHKESSHIDDKGSVFDESDLEIDADSVKEEDLEDEQAAIDKTSIKLYDSEIYDGIDTNVDSSAAEGDNEGFDLETDLSSMSCGSKDGSEQFSCLECESVFGNKLELHDHVADIHGNKAELSAKEEGKSAKRINLTMGERRDIIMQYEELPDHFSQRKKAEILGINRVTLRRFVNDREKILSQQNSAMRRMRHSYEKEVEDETLAWLQIVMKLSSVKSSLSPATISRKAACIANKMGKEWSYTKMGNDWALRLLKRHNINLDKKAGPELEAEATSMALSSSDAPEQFSCLVCELVLGGEAELNDHVANVHVDTTGNITLSSDELTFDTSIPSIPRKTRVCLSIKEKQVVLENYDMLPEDMPHEKKAECLGISRMTLKGFLQNREKILSQKNLELKTLRRSREKEVEDAVIAWLHNVLPSEAVSIPIITMKASEIAIKMGKDYHPSQSWTWRLLKRHNINLGNKSIIEGQE